MIAGSAPRTGPLRGAVTVGVGLLPRWPMDRFLDLAREIDATPSYDHLWIPDQRFFRDLSATLALVGSVTERLSVGSAVTDPFVRHPALTATMFATLQESTGGRAVMGIGAGSAGLAAMGIARPRPQQAVRDAIALCRHMWSGSREPFSSATVTFDDGLDVQPIPGRIPVWIAGRGARILELAGEVADGVLIGGLVDPTAVAYAQERIDRGCAAAGRAPDALPRGVWLNVALHAHPERARDAVRAMAVTVLRLSPSIADQVGVQIPAGLLARICAVAPGTDTREQLAVARQIPDEVVDAFTASGTPDDVRVVLQRLIDAGIDHLGLLPAFVPGQEPEEFLELLTSVVEPLRA